MSTLDTLIQIPAATTPAAALETIVAFATTATRHADASKASMDAMREAAVHGLAHLVAYRITQGIAPDTRDSGKLTKALIAAGMSEGNAKKYQRAAGYLLTNRHNDICGDDPGEVAARLLKANLSVAKLVRMADGGDDWAARIAKTLADKEAWELDDLVAALLAKGITAEFIR